MYFLSACCQDVDPICAVLSDIVYIFASDKFVDMIGSRKRVEFFSP